MGFTTATHLAYYSALAEVAAAALGNGEGKPKITEDLSGASPEQFSARVGQLLSF